MTTLADIEAGQTPGQQEMVPTTDWIGMARSAFKASDTYFNASIRPQVTDDLRQFYGFHPLGSKYLSDGYKARSRLFRPKTRAAIRKNEATAAEAFFSTDDVVSVVAENQDDPIDVAAASLKQHVLQHRLKNTIPWFTLCMGAYQDAQNVGVCISYQDWKYNPDKNIDSPSVALVPVENFRFDPAADWTDPVSTSPYLIQLLPMYIKDVKARMRKPQGTEGAWKQLAESSLQTAAKMQMDSVRQVRENQRQDSTSQSQSITDFSIVWVHRNIVEIDGQDWLYYTLGEAALLSDPVPMKQVYPHGRPYCVGSVVIETHKVYPSSLPRLTRDTQAEINDVANQRIDNVKFALHKRYFVKRSKQVDVRSLTRATPGGVTMLTDLDDVRPNEVGDVTSSAYAEQDRLNLDFDDVSGTFSGSTVQSNRKLNETVGGLNMLTTNANQVGAYQLRTFVETWVKPVLTQMSDMIRYYETDEAIIALAGKKAKIAMLGMVDTDMLLTRPSKVSVNVGMGATNPHDQVEKFMYGLNTLRNLLADGVLEKYGMNIEEVLKEIFGKLGFGDGSRFFGTDGQDPRLTAAQQTIEELRQQLAQKVSPDLVAKQIEKLDAEINNLAAKEKDTMADVVKKGVESAFAAMQAAQVIATVPQTAPIADAVMQAAGYQPPDPGGVDPNFPQPQVAGTGIPPPVDMQPASPFEGERAGIETVRPDSVQ